MAGSPAARRCRGRRRPDGSRACGAGRLGDWLDRLAPTVFILPAVLIVLAMSIFPLLVSLYLSLSRFKLAGRRLSAATSSARSISRSCCSARSSSISWAVFAPVALVRLAAAGGVAWLLLRRLVGLSAGMRRGHRHRASDRPRWSWPRCMLAVALLFAATPPAPAASSARSASTLVYVVGGVAAAVPDRPRPRPPVRAADRGRAASSASCSSSR